MTAFNVNSGGIVKWDSLSGGSTNATRDSYAISAGSTLLIETDSFQCVGHSLAFGSLDDVTFSGIGGKCKLDGTNVRVIPFNTGSGTVPAIDTTISQGGVSSKLLGVWSSWQSEPLAAAASMPSSGFIKVKDKTGGSFASGALTGISASATGADVVGWIEVRVSDSSVATVPRIGEFEIAGDWFELGTTNATRGQVLACPTTATAAGVFPGVEIETSAGSGTYVWYANAGSRVASSTPTAEFEGRLVWFTTSGVRIGNDGTNNVGYLPATGCKVRIPNVIVTTCTRSGSGSGARVVPNSSLSSRFSFTTTNGGKITFSKGVIQAYCSFNQPFEVAVLDSAISSQLYIEKQSRPLNIQRSLVGPVQAQTHTPLAMVSCKGGGSVEDSFFVGYGNGYCAYTNYISGVTFLRSRFERLLGRGGNDEAWQVLNSVDCIWTDVDVIGGAIKHTGSLNPQHTNSGYVDCWNAATDSNYGQNALDFGAGCSGILVSGFRIPTANRAPYNSLASFTACSDFVVQLIGSRASVLDLGSVTRYVVASGGNNTDGALKRVYGAPLSYEGLGFGNTDNRITLESVHCGYSAGVPIAALNMTVKALGAGPQASGLSAVYGTHFSEGYIDDAIGQIIAAMNEPTTGSASQCAITAGTPRFTSDGRVILAAVGDQVTLEMPHFALGHSSPYDAWNATSIDGTNTGNINIEFQWNFGSGWNGTWTAVSNSNWLAVGAFTGNQVKLKFRLTCATANAANDVRSIRMWTNTSTGLQATALYPLSTVNFTMTGIVSGSRYRLEELDGTLIGEGTSSGGPDVITYEWASDITARLIVRKSSGAPKLLEVVRTILLTNQNQSVIVEQLPATVAL